MNGTSEVANKPPFGLSMVAMLALLAAVCLAAILGYSTARCQQAGDALFWSAIVVIGPVVTFGGGSPTEFLLCVGGFLSTAAALVYLRFRLTVARIAGALVAIYILVAVVSWLLGAEASCHWV
jgi:hypothetical protein